MITNTLLNLSGQSVNPDDVMSDENVVSVFVCCSVLVN